MTDLASSHSDTQADISADSIAQSPTPLDVHVYVDVVCPWCYIGKRRLDRAVDAFSANGSEVRVRYMPFQLDPQAPHHHPQELMPRLAEKFGGEQAAASNATHITEIAATEGLELDFDAALSNNTLDAHRVLRAAGDRDLSVQADLVERMFQAHFSDGQDIGSPEVLAQLSRQAGLDVDVAALLSTEEGVSAVIEQQEAARAAGITAVPTYVFASRWGISGAQEVSTLLMVLQQVQAQADAQPGWSGGCGCGSGGCGGGGGCGCGGGGCGCGGAHGAQDPHAGGGCACGGGGCACGA